MAQDVEKVFEDNAGTAPLQQGRVIIDDEGSPSEVDQGTDMPAWHEAALQGEMPAAPSDPYNIGDTATHEVGHWMGDEPEGGPDGLSDADAADEAAKRMDRSSPLIQQALTKDGVVEGGPGHPGTDLAVAPGPPEEPEAPADVQAAETSDDDFMQLELENVQITSYQLGVLDNEASPGSGAAIPDLMTEGATPEEPATPGDPPSAGGPPVNDPTALFSFNPQPEPPGYPEAFEHHDPAVEPDEPSTLQPIDGSLGNLVNIGGGLDPVADLPDMEADFESLDV